MARLVKIYRGSCILISNSDEKSILLSVVEYAGGEGELIFSALSPSDEVAVFALNHVRCNSARPESIAFVHFTTCGSCGWRLSQASARALRADSVTKISCAKCDSLLFVEAPLKNQIEVIPAEKRNISPKITHSAEEPTGKPKQKAP